MLKTVIYEIWPRDTKFAECIETVINAISEELKVAVSTNTFRKVDSVFTIDIDENENVRFEDYTKFIPYFKTVPIFQSFECNVAFSRKKVRKSEISGVWIAYSRQSVTVTSHSEDTNFVNRSHEIVRGILKLEKVIRHDEDNYRWKFLDPKVFISRHFDAESNGYFNEIQEFLNLLGFSVNQGEEYVSGAIPEKVKHRMDQQDIVIVIVSGIRDHDWLIAEIGYAAGKGKHIVILKEKQASINMTIMGRDYEFIEFDQGNIQKTYCKLLREFRSTRVKGIF